MIQLNQKKHGRVLFWTLLLMLLGLCIVRYALQVNFPRPILLGMIILIAALGDRDEIMAVCVCCIPLNTSLHYGYAVLACIVIYGLKYGYTIRFNLSVVLIIIMMLWEILHCFWGGFSIATLVGNCVPLLLLLALALSVDANEYDYALIVRALAIGIAAMCILLLGKLAYSANFNFIKVFANLQRLGLDSEDVKEGLTVVGGEQNPNTLGVMCVLGITGLVQLRMSGQKKFGDMALAFFLLGFGVLTASRTYLVCLALMGVLLLFSQKGSLGKKLKFVGAIVLVALLALGVLYLIFPALIEFYISRFHVEDVTTGRLDLMVVYHDFIVSNPVVMLFGIGLQNFTEKVLVVYRVAAYVPHNGIQELIVAWGLPGLLMFLILWVVMVVRSRKCCKKQGLINYIPLFVILLKAQAGQMLDSPYTMLSFTFAYLSMCANLTEPEQKALEE